MAYTLRQQPVINLIYIGKVEIRIALCILVVHSNLVVKDAMEADIPHAHLVVNFLQVPAIVIAQRQNRVTGAEHLLPKMRKWARNSFGVDRDGCWRGLRAGGAAGSHQAKRKNSNL